MEPPLHNIAQSTLEDFTRSVWLASPLGRDVLLRVVTQFYEDHAVALALATPTHVRNKAKVKTAHA